jgi:hypothetical protein
VSARNGAAPPVLALHRLGPPPAATALPPPRTPPARATARRPALLAAGALVVAWAALATLQLVAAHRDAATATADAEAARSALGTGSLDARQVADLLHRAAGRFHAAARRAGGLLVAPVRLLPVAGRQVRSFGALTRAAGDTAAIAAGTVEAAEALAGDRWARPDARVSLVRELAATVTRAEASLAAVDRSRHRALVAPLARRWAELDHQVAVARGALQRGAAVLPGLADFLAGPRRYLVLAANNAEMRAGSGMFLSAGVLDAGEGRLALGPMQPTGSLTLPGPGVPVEGDLADRWGWLQPGREWRNLATTPRFDAVAPVAARMWEELTGQRVDGVLAVDVELIRAVLEATGPVAVDGSALDSSTVVGRLLYDQYHGADFTDPVQADRRDELGRVAATVVEALEAGAYRPPRLVAELARAARGRHLLAWSAHPGDQATWTAAGIAGTLTPDSLAVNVLNRGGNKLDQFLRVGGDLEVRPTTEGTDVTVHVRLRNEAPEDAPPYVAGPHPASGVGAGDYLGIVAVNLPQAATGVRIEGLPQLATAGPDGPTTVAAGPVLVPRGGEGSVVVRFRLPPGWRSIVVTPSARTPPVTWTTGSASWPDDTPRTVSWAHAGPA